MSPPSDIAPPRAGLGRLEPHPEQIGKYRIDHVVGRGAVGIVYKAYDVHIDRAVAIKALQPEILADIASNADTLKRFAAEVRSAGRCLHPNIVTVFDYMEENGAPYIIMEYVPAGTLESVIKSGARLPIRQVSEIMVQLLHALEHAHGKSVIHRDVKPSNILCHSAASIKVADFGIAQINTLDLTRTGRFGIVGTPNYMAPERFIGRPDDARGDLYSAGVVLFQLLTGQTPFTATDTHELMNKILNAEPASAQALRPGLSDAWVAVTKRSLARNPDDRYQTAREFLDELRAALNADTSDSTPSLDLTQYSTEIPRDRDRSGSSRGGTSQSMVERLRPDTLAELERTLAMSVGPIAKLLVKRAATEFDRYPANADGAHQADEVGKRRDLVPQARRTGACGQRRRRRRPARGSHPAGRKRRGDGGTAADHGSHCKASGGAARQDRRRQRRLLCPSRQGAAGPEGQGHAGAIAGQVSRR